MSNLSPSAASLITSALPSSTAPSTLSRTAKLAQLPPSSRASAKIWADAQESFILLSESTIGPPHPTPIPPPAKIAPYPVNSPTLAANLHALLSSRTPIDHPLCTECTALLQSELQKQLEELSRERDAYLDFEKGILRNRDNLAKGRKKEVGDGDGLGEDDIEGTKDEWEALMRRKKESQEEEGRLRKVLEEREKELELVRAEEERVKREDHPIEKFRLIEDYRFLLSHARLQTEQNHLQAALHTAQTHLLLYQSLLAHLESANVYNDAFQIGHVPLHPQDKGSITVGTINGLRLGGRPLVEWDEINAGWGLVALCIDRVGVKVGCTFEG